MNEMTVASCAAPLWDAGCRPSWAMEKCTDHLAWWEPCRWWNIERDIPGVDHRVMISHPQSHEAAVLLLSQAEMEIAEQCDNYCLSAPSDECKQDKWEIEMFVRARNDFCVVEAATKHEVKVAAYLAMKGVEG